MNTFKPCMAALGVALVLLTAAARAEEKPAIPDSLPEGLTKVEFSEGQKDELLKKYPFLKNDISLDPETEKMYEQYGTAKYVYDAVHDKETGTDLLFVGVSHPYFCGSLGCMYFIYRNDGGEYRLVNSFTIPGVIFVLKKKDDISLVIDAPNGAEAQWTYSTANKKYNFTGTYAAEGKTSTPAPQ